MNPRAIARGNVAVSAAVLLNLVLVMSPVQALEPGKAVYESTCVACHGKDAKGALPGIPSLRKKDGPLAKTDEELLRSILRGYQSPGSPLAMPPKGGNPALTESDARAVLQYMRSAFGK